MMFEEITGKQNSKNNWPFTNIAQEGSFPQQRSYELEIMGVPPQHWTPSCVCHRDPFMLEHKFEFSNISLPEIN